MTASEKIQIWRNSTSDPAYKPVYSVYDNLDMHVDRINIDFDPNVPYGV